MCCQYERLSPGVVLDQLENAEPENPIAAELDTAMRHAVTHSVINCVCHYSRGVRSRGYAIQAAPIRHTDEQRKQPPPQNGEGKDFAMAVQ